MRQLIRAGPRLLAAGVLATTLVLAGTQRAEAQSVLFSGYTQGCFDEGLGCTPVSGQSIWPNSAGLTFTANPSFSGTTTNGVLNLTGANGFGSFYYNNLQPFNWTANSTTFTLLITFLDPTSTSNLFTAALTGNVVVPIGQNPLTVTFPSGTQTWSSGGYQYSVAVNSLVVIPETPTPVTGQVTATAVPEPITMILLGTGLAGVGAARRRRMKVTKADLI